MGAQHLQRPGRGGCATPAGKLLGQNLDRAVHADGEDLFDIGDIGIGRAMLDVGAKAADPGLDQNAIGRMRPDGARQVQQLQRALQRHAFGRPALGQAGARRFRRGLGRLAALDIGAEAARAQGDRQAIGVFAQHLAVNRHGRAFVAAADGAGIAAVGIIAASDEGPARPRGLQMQPPRPADRTRARIGPVRAGRIKMRAKEFVDLVQHLADAQIGGFGNRGGKVAPEAGQHFLVVAFPGRDVVKLRFQIGGEVEIDIAAEVVGQKGGDEPPLVFGDQAVLVLADIFAVLDRGDDAGIGRGAADAQFFHALDQRRLGIARRRLGEMLLGRDAPLFGRLTGHDLRQTAFIVALVITALVIDGQKAVEQHDLARGAQPHLPVRAEDVDRGAFHPRGGHLAGDGALPDQIIELALIGFRQAQLFRPCRHIGRADAFMRLLRVLGLVLVHARAVGNIGRPEAALDLVTGGHHGLGGHVDAVGAHVGDVPRLIQPLRGVHRGLGAHAVFAAGLLLQGRGHEGRIGIARGGLGLDTGDLQRARGDGRHRQFSGLGRGNVEFRQLPPTQNGQRRLELLPARGGENGLHRPVFLGAEGLDLHLALDDQAQADRLHAARRFCPRQFAPQHRRQGKAHKVIQRPARQIGIDQRGIDLARGLHRRGHRILGDGVEGDAADGLALLDA